MIGITAPTRIRQLDTDPTSPNVCQEERVYHRDTWVLHTPAVPGVTAGMPVGLLMAITHGTNTGSATETYQLSANTTGGIKRITL